MSNFIRIVFILLLFSSTACVCINDPIDKAQVDKRVNLNSEDLVNFKRLSVAMVQDFPKLAKQNDSLRTLAYRDHWLRTNSYYLDLIDAAKYRSLLAPLKGKLKDDFAISDSGDALFILKEYTQRKCDTYNDTYTHLIFSNESNFSSQSLFGDIQTIYLDSIINDDWKYEYFLTHTGH